MLRLLRMQYDSIEFKGRSYRLRTLDFGEDFGVYNVASLHLDRLLVDELGSYTSREAKFVDEQIFYFIPPSQFRLSDEKLRSTILSEI